MKHLIILSIAILWAASLNAQCADTANIYTFNHNGKRYEVVKESKSWVAAAACAVSRGGYLVEINDKEEQKAVYDAIIKGAKVPANYVSVSTGGGVAYVWIGATDKKSEGTWLWDGNNDGLGVSFWMGQGVKGQNNGRVMLNAYNNWGGISKGKANEPDNFAQVQHCAGLSLAVWPNKTSSIGIEGEWNDLICSTPLYYIIEFEK